MKLLKIILIIIVIYLISISFRLTHLSILLSNFDENVQRLINSNREVVESNHYVADSIAELSRQVKESGIKVR